MITVLRTSSSPMSIQDQAAPAPRIARFNPIVPDLTWLERLVPLGVETIQLRLKDASPAEVRRQIAGGIEICRTHRCVFIVNDYWREAIELGAEYLHLGQEDLAVADVKAIKRAGMRLGISTHDHAELDIALSAEPDYIALGPRSEERRVGKECRSRWSPYH